jgi:hypothetical protein
MSETVSEATRAETYRNRALALLKQARLRNMLGGLAVYARTHGASRLYDRVHELEAAALMPAPDGDGKE